MLTDGRWAWLSACWSDISRRRVWLYGCLLSSSIMVVYQSGYMVLNDGRMVWLDVGCLSSSMMIVQQSRDEFNGWSSGDVLCVLLVYYYDVCLVFGGIGLNDRCRMWLHVCCLSRSIMIV